MSLPYLKKNDELAIKNYRPITILSSVSKVFEKLVHNRIVAFLDKFNIICKNQHGFRAGHSVETASNDFLKCVYNELDSNNYVIGMFFDLSMAFDLVDVDFIIQKLHVLGIRGIISKWIESYLHERKLVVKLGNEVTKEYDVQLGVPQGSVLGPLIFLLFINDLPSFITEGSVIMFADDTSVVISAKHVEGIKEKSIVVLQEFYNWCRRNRLIANLDKTVMVNFHFRKSLSNYSVQHNNIEYKLSRSVKFLGSIVDENLSWNLHIDHTCNKLNKCYFAVLQLKPFMDQNTMLTIYYALGYSHLSFTICAWGRATMIQRTFVLQKRILRLIFNINFCDTCKPLFQSQNILTVPSIYIYKSINFIKKNINTFIKSSDIHSHNVRNKNEIRPQMHNLSKYEKSPEYAGITFFNKLPANIKNIKDYTTFKNRLKLFLIQKAYYSVNEYLMDSSTT